jgi:hypothetical protein
MMGSAHQAAISGSRLKQSTSTSSPPRCTMFPGKRPWGEPTTDAVPPVTSLSSDSISSNVALRDGFSGRVEPFCAVHAVQTCG